MQSIISNDAIEQFVNKLPNFNGWVVKTVNEGVSTEVFKLVNADKCYYFRLHSKGENASTEVLAHKLIRKKQVKVPKAIYYEDFNQELGRSFLINSEITGRPVKANDPNITDILSEAGKQLALLNTITINGVGWLKTNSLETKVFEVAGIGYDDFIFKNLESMVKDLESWSVFSSALVKSYLKYSDDVKSLFDYTTGHLVHGDFGIDHIFSHDGKFSGFIDLGDVRSASIYHDLSTLYIYSPELLSLVIAGYKKITTLPKDYTERIIAEAAIFAVGRLWWRVKNNPRPLSEYCELDLIKNTVSKTGF